MRTSYGTPSSCRVSTAWHIVSQSDFDPMTMPISGCEFSFNSIAQLPLTVQLIWGYADKDKWNSRHSASLTNQIVEFAFKV